MDLRGLECGRGAATNLLMVRFEHRDRPGGENGAVMAGSAAAADRITREDRPGTAAYHRGAPHESSNHPNQTIEITETVTP